MGIEYKKILNVFLFVFFVFNISAEKIYLKNGQVIQGKIISEDEKFVRIKISVGETKLEQAQIVKIESDKKDEKQNSEKNILSVPELVSAGEKSLAAGNKHEAIIYFKKAWVKSGKKEQSIRERFWKLEQEYSQEVISDINKLIEQSRFRSAAKSVDENLRIFRKRPKVLLSLRKIKNDIYREFLSDENTLEYFVQVLDKWSYINLSESNKNQPRQRSAKRKKRDRKRNKSNKKKLESDTSYSSFTKKIELIDPRYHDLIQAIIPLYSFHKFIVENQFAFYASQKLYSKKELDAARGNRDSFRSMCADNDKIYKSRSACKQFNMTLLKAKNEYSKISEEIRQENEKWQSQGYEKIGGEWLKGNELKKAKGLVYYHGQWLDPNSSDFDEKMAKIDKNLADSIKKENEKKKLIEEEQRKLKKEAEQLEKAEEESSAEANDNEIEAQQKKLSDSIQKAFTPQKKSAKSTEKSRPVTKKMSVDDTSDFPVDEGEKGLPTPIGVGILAFLGFVLYLNKKNKNK